MKQKLHCIGDSSLFFQRTRAVFEQRHRLFQPLTLECVRRFGVMLNSTSIKKDVLRSPKCWYSAVRTPDLITNKTKIKGKVVHMHFIKAQRAMEVQLNLF
jgi:hypothetical protein